MSFSQRKTNNYKLARAIGFVPSLFAMMRKAAFAAALALLSAAPGHAQRAEASATIEAAAGALGMIRGVQRRMDSINTVEFSGTGSLSVPEAGGRWIHYDVTNATIAMSYYIPAMRWDMTRTASDGSEQRTIHVVRGDRAWDEKQPGVDAIPADGRAADRQRQIWLTPHGVIRAAVEAEAASPGSVTVGARGGATTLTVQVDGTPITATLNEDYRPQRVGMMIEHPVLGRTRIEAAYTEYVDWQLLDVYFPSRIVQTLGEQTTLDLTISEFFQNPYVVFPTPEQLVGSSQ